MTTARAEELLATLALIAGLISWHIGWHVFAILLFAKAVFDALCSIYFARKEISKGKDQLK